MRKPRNSDNSETGEVDEVLTIHEDDRTLYQEQKESTAKASLETPSENDPIFSAAIKGFSDSDNADDKKLGQAVADDMQNAVMLAFNETIPEDHLKKLLEQRNLPDNCKAGQAKLSCNFFNSFSCNQEVLTFWQSLIFLAITLKNYKLCYLKLN